VAYLGFCEGGAEPKTRGSRRRRRQWGAVWGGGVPSPLKKGLGRGLCPIPRNLEKKISVQCVQKIFVFRPKGGHRPVAPLLNTPLETRELPGERDNARNNARCMQARKATHGLDGQTSRLGQDSPWKSQSE